MREWFVYAAGPISGADWKGIKDWRGWMESYFDETPITILSPLRYKDDLLDTTRPIDTFVEETSPLVSDKGINRRDLFDVSRADLLFVNFLGAPRVSIGTCIELGAAAVLKKPVVVVMDELHAHPMINDIAGWQVNNLEEGFEIVKAILLP